MELLIFLCVPLLFGWTFFRFNSGEIMICDAQDLRFARRRPWGHWGKQTFDSRKIRQLRKEFRGTSKTRSYSVLTFDYGMQTYDMLEEVTATEAEQILKACGALGLDVLIPHDPGTAMLRDIDERGWFVNPLKPD